MTAPQRLGRRARLVAEVVAVTVLALGVCAVMNAGALRHPGTSAPSGTTDSLILAWSVAWAGHALATDPGALFQGNTFFPAPDSLAFTDSLLGFAPVGMIGSGHQAALTRFSLLFAFVPAIGFVGGYLLGRQLGTGRWGGLLVAAVFAFPAWRGQEGAHLHVTATGGVALSLAMLARGHGVTARGTDLGRARPLWAFAGWLAAAWQLAASLTVGVPFVYLLGLFALVAAVHLALGPHRWGWRLPLADLLGGAVLAGLGLLIARVYLSVQEQNVAAVQRARGGAVLRRYSPDWLAYLRPPANATLLNDLVPRLPVPPGFPTIGALPGYTVLMLAVLGLAVSVFSWRRRLLLLSLATVTVVLGLGTTFPGGGRYTFLALYRHAPGWAAFRVPSRLTSFTTLFVALLAAGFVAALARQLRRRAEGRPRWVGAVALVPLAVLSAAPLAEASTSLVYQPAPPPPAAFRAAVEPTFVLPSLWYHESVPMWWSTDGFPRVGNGQSGFTPPTLTALRAATVRFPDPSSVGYLRAHGFRSIVVLGELAPGTPWQPAAAPVPRATADALGIRQLRYGPDWLYLLD